MSDGNDKIYIIIILVMIGGFIYWYQTKLDTHNECKKCNRRKKQVKNCAKYENPKIKNKSEKKKKKVTFKNEDTDISLDSLDSSDQEKYSSKRSNNKNDMDSLDM